MLNEITLFITKECNMNCDYCTQENNKDSIDDNESLELTIKTIESLIKDKKLSSKTSWHFFGGEPTLKFDKMLKLYKYLKTQGFKNFKLFTNGLIKESFLDHIPNDIMISISYDGLSQKNRSSKDRDKIINNIKYLITKNNFEKINFIYDEFLLKNYFFISDLLKIPEWKITHSLNRNFYWWTPERIEKYLTEFNALAEYNFFANIYRKNKDIEDIYFMYFQNIFNQSKRSILGCGLKDSRISIYPDGSIKNCGIRSFNEDDYVSQKEIESFCKNCEAYKFCDKKCPIEMKKFPELFQYSFCEIKINEIKTLEKYFKKELK